MPDLLKAINRFAVPLMLTGIIQLLYNAADSAIVGRFAGSEYLAAVGSTTTVVFLLITLFNGISVGAGYLVAHRFGADDREGVSDAVHCAVFLAVLMGLCAGTFGFFVSGPVLRLVEVPEDVVDLFDEEVPLTGDNMMLYVVAAVASATGLVYLTVSGKKREEEMAE